MGYRYGYTSPKKGYTLRKHRAIQRVSPQTVSFHLVGIYARGDELRIGDIAQSPVGGFYRINSLSQGGSKGSVFFASTFDKKAWGSKLSDHELATLTPQEIRKRLSAFPRLPTLNTEVEVIEAGLPTGTTFSWKVAPEGSKSRNDLGGYRIWRRGSEGPLSLEFSALVQQGFSRLASQGANP